MAVLRLRRRQLNWLWPFSRVTPLKPWPCSRPCSSPGLPQGLAFLKVLLDPVKKAGGGIRPIAAGKMWYWLDCLCALAGYPGAECSLKPLQQLGVDVTVAAQIVGHALVVMQSRDDIRANESQSFVKVPSA
jgi:hypothetical protein